MTYKIKIENFNNADISYIKNICEENKCELSIEWQSMYNKYVIYNYEPHCPVGFIINAYVSGEDIYKPKFIEYLYNERIKRINKLNAILNNEVKV